MVIAMVKTPRAFASSAISTGTLLRPDTEWISSTSPAFRRFCSTRILPSPSSRSSWLVRVMGRVLSMKPGKKMGLSTARPPVR